MHDQSSRGRTGRPPTKRCPEAARAGMTAVRSAASLPRASAGTASGATTHPSTAQSGKPRSAVSKQPFGQGRALDARHGGRDQNRHDHLHEHREARADGPGRSGEEERHRPLREGCPQAGLGRCEPGGGEPGGGDHGGQRRPGRQQPVHEAKRVEAGRGRGPPGPGGESHCPCSRAAWRAGRAGCRRSRRGRPPSLPNRGRRPGEKTSAGAFPADLMAIYEQSVVFLPNGAFPITD